VNGITTYAVKRLTDINWGTQYIKRDVFYRPVARRDHMKNMSREHTLSTRRTSQSTVIHHVMNFPTKFRSWRTGNIHGLV